MLVVPSPKKQTATWSVLRSFAESPAPVATPTPPAAAALLEQLTAHAAHEYWPALPVPVAAVFARVMGHQQVMDAYLVSLAERHRGRLVTFDRQVAVHAAVAASVFVLAAQ